MKNLMSCWHYLISPIKKTSPTRISQTYIARWMFFYLLPYWRARPVPVLEAMMSNCVPVASKTGFCPDIIDHGNNGYLFETDASYSDVIPLIEEAFTNKNNIRETVLQYTWQNCSKKIDDLFLN